MAQHPTSCPRPRPVRHPLSRRVHRSERRHAAMAPTYQHRRLPQPARQPCHPARSRTHHLHPTRHRTTNHQRRRRQLARHRNDPRRRVRHRHHHHRRPSPPDPPPRRTRRHLRLPHPTHHRRPLPPDNRTKPPPTRVNDPLADIDALQTVNDVLAYPRYSLLGSM